MSRNNQIYPVENARELDWKARKLIQNPKRILRKYINEGMTVMDFGCGTGFFSVEIAKMVGKSGKVIAVDLQEEMLAILKGKIQGKDIADRILVHQSKEDEIGIIENIDLIVAFYVIHECPNQSKILEEMKSILKPGGKLFIVEPSYFHVSKEEFEETVSEAVDFGFTVEKRPRIFWSRAVILQNTVN